MSSLVFLGTYTDHAILPHWPHSKAEGEGLTVARWAPAAAGGETSAALVPLRTVPIPNPAFMK